MGGRQHLTHRGGNGQRLYAPFNRPRSLHAFQSGRGKQGGGSAAVARPLPCGCPGVEQRKSDMGATLIHQDHRPDIQVARLLAPRRAGDFIPFAGCEHLFLCGQGSYCLARDIVATRTVWSCVSSHQAQWCAKVAAGWAWSQGAQLSLLLEGALD